MNANPEDRLSLPIHWPLLGAAAAGLALLLAGLAVVDRKRAERQLATLESSFCHTEVPDGLLDQIDQLATSEAASEDLAKSIATRFSELHRGSVQAYYQHRGELWSLTGWYGVQLASSAHLSDELGGWSAPWPAEDCRAARAAKTLVVARRLRTPGGRGVLVLLTWWRTEEFFD